MAKTERTSDASRTGVNPDLQDMEWWREAFPNELMGWTCRNTALVSLNGCVLSVDWRAREWVMTLRRPLPHKLPIWRLRLSLRRTPRCRPAGWRRPLAAQALRTGGTSSAGRRA